MHSLILLTGALPVQVLYDEAADVCPFLVLGEDGVHTIDKFEPHHSTSCASCVFDIAFY